MQVLSLQSPAYLDSHIIDFGVGSQLVYPLGEVFFLAEASQLVVESYRLVASVLVVIHQGSFLQDEDEVFHVVDAVDELHVELSREVLSVKADAVLVV